MNSSLTRSTRTTSNPTAWSRFNQTTVRRSDGAPSSPLCVFLLIQKNIASLRRAHRRLVGHGRGAENRACADGGGGWKLARVPAAPTDEDGTPAGSLLAVRDLAPLPREREPLNAPRWVWELNGGAVFGCSLPRRAGSLLPLPRSSSPRRCCSLRWPMGSATVTGRTAGAGCVGIARTGGSTNAAPPGQGEGRALRRGASGQPVDEVLRAVVELYQDQVSARGGPSGGRFRLLVARTVGALARRWSTSLSHGADAHDAAAALFLARPC